jgi:hypothetical protein
MELHGHRQGCRREGMEAAVAVWRWQQRCGGRDGCVDAASERAEV